MRLTILLASCLFFPCSASLALAQTPSYPDFTNIAGLVLNGDAAQSGAFLRLTTTVAGQRGSAWFDTPVQVAGGFQCTFRFRLTQPATSGGDGMAFVIQNDPRTTSALTESGNTLGYGHDPASPPGTGIVSSLAFEVDTYLNGDQTDTSGNEISVHTNASGENSQDELYSLGAATPVANMSDASPHLVHITYVPGTLEVYVDDLATPVLSLAYDITTGGTWTNGSPVAGLSLLPGGTAWVGFTAANGAAWENHDLMAWEWSGSSGIALCFGDGTGTPCPCGNTGAAGEGCENSLGSGAVLSATGSASLVSDSLVLTALQTTNQPGIFFQGNNTLAPGLIFGDGLRCCGGGVVRIVTVQPAGNCAASDLSCGNQIGGMGGPISQHPGNAGLQAGDTRCYQWWYRDPGAGNPCGVDYFNLSNAVETTWGA